MVTNKTAVKTADIQFADLPAKIPQAHGGALFTGGVTGNRGGRPSDEFKARMAEIASSDAALAYLEECITGAHGPKAAASARVYATEHGYGKVPAAFQVSGPNGGAVPVEMTIRLIRPDAVDHG